MPVLCLAGTWCGDCARQCPIFGHLEAAQPLIQMRFLDRDEHADVQRVLQLVTDKAAQAQIPFNQRRQGRHCLRRIDGARSEPAHFDVALGESARPQRRRCEMISMQI